MLVQVCLEKAEETRPRSISIYYTNLRSRLQTRGVEFIEAGFEAGLIDPRVDLLWAPGMGNRRLPRVLLRRQRPAIVTVHGLQGLTDPPRLDRGLRPGLGHFLWRCKIRLDWLRAGRNIDRIIVVSDTLKAQAARKLRRKEDQFAVIYHGIDFAFFNEVVVAREQEDFWDRPFVHVSQYSEVKNLPRLIEAYRRHAARIGRRLEIHSPGFSVDPGNLPEGCTVHTTFLSHAEVRAILGRSHGFVFPSTEDSFGFPAFEAMAAGLPVITSHGIGTAEVARGAASLVDPLDVDDIGRAMAELSNRPEFFLELQQKGLQRARDLSWDRSAEEHLALFQSTIRKGPGRADG